MTRVRQAAFVGLVLLGTQVLVGCCFNRPVFPRAYNALVGTGTCLTPIFHRPFIGAPYAGAPLAGGYAEAPIVAGPVHDATCAGCSAPTPAVPVVSQPVTTVPVVVSKPGTNVAPGVMPGATSGIPHDSSLIVPTVKPPTVQELHNESKKVIVAGK